MVYKLYLKNVRQQLKATSKGWKGNQNGYRSFANIVMKEIDQNLVARRK